MCNSLLIFSLCLLLYRPVVFVCFFAMSFSVSADLVSDHLAQSQAASSIDLHDTSFNLSEKTFSTIFQNIRKCEYAGVKTVFLTSQINNLTLFHLKIRSFQKNFNDLHELLCNLSEPPHIICFSETKIKHNTLLNLSIPGYKFLNVNSLTNAGGVEVFISDVLHYEKLRLINSFPAVSISGSELSVQIQTFLM